MAANPVEHIAFQIGDVPVVFDGPYVHNLSSWLLRLAKGHRRSARTVTRLFGKLTLCSGEGSFIGRDQAFWDRPRSNILPAPERNPRMTEQDFDVTAPSSIEEKPSALCAR